MLLFAEKDTFELLRVCEGMFYEKYKFRIDHKIDKVISDFNMSQSEIEVFIEIKGIVWESHEEFEHNKIWIVFAPGFAVMHGEIIYNPHQTAEQMFSLMENHE